MCSLSVGGGTGLALCYQCVCVYRWMYRCLHVCVCTEKSPLNAPCSKPASEASHQTASALPFVLRASGVPPHFFTSLCHVLICSWSDIFHELQACWSDNSEFLYNENSLKSKRKTKSRSRASLAEHQCIFLIKFLNCMKTRWRVLWLCLNYE